MCKDVPKYVIIEPPLESVRYGDLLPRTCVSNKRGANEQIVDFLFLRQKRIKQK